MATQINKNWFSLFMATFTGIFNDNFLKNIIVFVGITWALPEFLTRSVLLTLVSAGLVIPYLIFTPLSGVLAKKYSKVLIYKYSKIAEILIMIFASIGILIHSVSISIISVFLMGTQTCINSPSKYGIIKDIEGVGKLEFGNGMIEMFAFLGILIGTILASFASDYFNVYMICGIFIFLAFSGFLSVISIHIQESPGENCKNDTLNPLKFLKESYQFAKKYKGINISVFGNSMFWLIGGVIQMNLVIHGTITLHESNTVTGIIMSFAAVGIALGCWVAGKITTINNQKSLIMIGLTCMIICLLFISIFNPPTVIFEFIIFILAFFCGIYEVPFLPIIQRAPIGRKVGDMIAYLNFVTFIFVLIGTGIFYLITIFTGENSIAVFKILSLLAIVTWFIVFFKLKSDKREENTPKSTTTSKC